MMMVDSISATTSSIINGFHHHPHHQKFPKNKNSVSFTSPTGGRSDRRLRSSRAGPLTVRSLAMELTKEAHPSEEEEGRRLAPPGSSRRRLWPPTNRADDPSLHNPLRRQERMGCGWLAAIFEWEGVLVEADPQLERQAWLVLAQEEGRSPPPAFLLRRIEGMKSEQAVSEVLCWSRDPSQVRRLASRKEDIHRSLRGGGFYRLRSGSGEFLATLLSHDIPVAVASTRPRRTLREAMEAVGVGAAFAAVVAAEDVHRGKPDPEMFACVAQLLGFVPERCIVFGSSNSAVEAAHDARMKCVAVASGQPVYELGAADLVVRRLDELSVVDLKNLADISSPEFEPEVEMEEEEEDPSPSSAVAVDDPVW